MTLQRNALIYIFASLFTFLFVSLISFRFFRSRPSLTTNQPPLIPAPTLPPPISPNPDQHVLGILLLGYGGPGHQGGYLADVIQIAYLDFDHSRFNLISLPRDLYLTFPDGVSRKLNAVFAAQAKEEAPYPREHLDPDTARAAFKNFKSLVSGLTGLPIDYAIGIDFVGYQRLIGGVLDGVTINNQDPLDDSWYPIRGEELNPCGHSPEDIASLSATLSGFNLEKQFPCRYEHILVPAGLQTLDGHTALAYVRSRHSSSDYARSRRQQTLLLGVRDKLFSLHTLSDLPTWYELITQHVATDLDLNFVTNLTGNLNQLPQFQVTNINLSPDNVLTASTNSTGAFILIPKTGLNQWAATQAYLRSQLSAP